MGMKIVPELLHSIVNNLFENSEWVYMYIDDILVVSSMLDEYNGHLKQVLDRCLSSALAQSAEKRVLAQPNLTLLGHELS